MGTFVLILLIPVAYFIGKQNIDLNQFKGLKLNEIIDRITNIVDAWINKIIKK